MSERGYLALGAVGAGFLVVGLGLRWLGEGVGAVWLVQWAVAAVAGFAAYGSEHVRTAGARVASTRPVQAVTLLAALGATVYCGYAVALSITAVGSVHGAVLGGAFYGVLGTFGLAIVVKTAQELLGSTGAD